jgi:hypothetical protein
MNSPAYALRFFRVVAPVPRLTIATFFVLAVAAGAKVAIDPSSTAGALVPIFVLQVFATASGFAVPARRGHYDLLLTSGDSRFRIAFAQWVATVAPGIAAWLAVSCVEAAATFGHGALARASGTVTTAFLVSTLPWAITVPLPRFSGAVGWLLVLVTVVSFSTPRQLSALAWPPGIPHADLVPGLGVLLFPMSLIGRDVSAAFLGLAAPAVLISVLAMTTAVVWIYRADFALEAGQ